MHYRTLSRICTLSALLLSSLVGCQSVKQLYQGPRLEPDKIATLTTDPMKEVSCSIITDRLVVSQELRLMPVLAKIKGPGIEEVSPDADSVELMPGKYTVSLSFTGEAISNETADATIELVAAHHYRAHIASARGLPDGGVNAKLSILEVETGKDTVAIHNSPTNSQANSPTTQSLMLERLRKRRQEEQEKMNH